MAALARWYSAQLERAPLATKMVTAGTLYSLGDVVGQTLDG